MFGSSNLLGQSAGAPFGSQSQFGQSNVTNSPFAPNPFGSQTGGSVFGSTSTGVFGQSSTPLSSTPAFGSASPSGFGSSTPAFGSSSSSFGGSSVFGGLGSNPQSSPFGNSFQQSQPAFGPSPSFGASSQPSFGGSSTSAFGSSTTPPFGSAGIPGFGNMNTATFGSTPTNTFGASGSGGAFGSSSNSVFGNASAFGSTTPSFGATTTPAFGASITSGFGSGPAFGAASTPSFGTSSLNFGSTSTSTFGVTPSPFAPQGSSFGSQATNPTIGGASFGQPSGSQRGGSRVASYTTTPDADGGTQQTKLLSLSAMPVYKDKSHEELRWEDYQQGDKGGPNPAVQSNTGMNFGVPATQSNLVSSSTFGQSSANPASVQSNPFASKPQGFGTTGFGTSSAPAFASSTFGGTSTPSPFGSTPSPSLFGGAATPSPFGSTPSPSLFGGAATPSSFGSTSAQSSSVFASSTPAFGSNTSLSPFGASGIASSSMFGSTSNQGAPTSFGPTSAFGNTQSSSTPLLGQTGASLVQNSSPFGQPNTSSAPSNGFGANMFSSTPSFSTSNQFGNAQSTPSLSTPFQPTLPTQSSNAFSFGNFGQTQSAGAGGYGNGSSILGQSLGQSSANQSFAVAQQVAVINPFGTLPAMPQMSIGNIGTSSSIQFGISNMPVVDKPSPVRISSLLTSRHLSQRRIRLPVRKYHPKPDDLRVPFFSDSEETNTTKGDARFMPRQNPRALVIQPTYHGPIKSPIKDACVMLHGNGKTSKEHDHTANGSVTAGHDNNGTENGSAKEHIHPTKINQNQASVSAQTLKQNGDSNIKFSGHITGGKTTHKDEHGADIMAIMPKLLHSDYFTQPDIQDLSSKERAQPGFSRNVKDFVVGRHGYGSIKFIGETDVRSLNLDSLLIFNNREVTVYPDETKKPPVGQGLNKPAEVTLLNIKGYDKNTRTQILEGPKLEKYTEMLRKKAEEQGAEYVSYEPVEGEWKFRVKHFSKYVF